MKKKRKKWRRKDTKARKEHGKWKKKQLRSKKEKRKRKKSGCNEVSRGGESSPPACILIGPVLGQQLQDDIPVILKTYPPTHTTHPHTPPPTRPQWPKKPKNPFHKHSTTHMIQIRLPHVHKFTGRYWEITDLTPPSGNLSRPPSRRKREERKKGRKEERKKGRKEERKKGR